MLTFILEVAYAAMIIFSLEVTHYSIVTIIYVILSMVVVGWYNYERNQMTRRYLQSKCIYNPESLTS